MPLKCDIHLGVCSEKVCLSDAAADDERKKIVVILVYNSRATSSVFVMELVFTWEVKKCACEKHIIMHVTRAICLIQCVFVDVLRRNKKVCVCVLFSFLCITLYVCRALAAARDNGRRWQEKWPIYIICCVFRKSVLYKKKKKTSFILIRFFWGWEIIVCTYMWCNDTRVYL